MKMMIMLLSLLSLSAFADVTYKCYDVQRVNGYSDVTMTINTALFSKKIKSVDLVNEIKNQTFEETENPFTSRYADYYQLDRDAVDEASKHTFKKISRPGFSTKTIALSESILKFEKTGYAHYYSHMCLILECNTSSFYFKCDRL